MPPLCLILSDDLIDTSRVVGEGRAAGIETLHCRKLDQLAAVLNRNPSLIIVDLHFPELNLDSLLQSAGAIPIIGFGAHVDAERLKSARKAGCREVLPRSAFFENLREKLAAWTT